MSYPIKFRQHVLMVKDRDGLTFAQTAARFSVGVASIVRWSRRIETAYPATRQSKIDMAALARDVELYPDAFQRERAARFGVSQKAIWAALQRLKVSYKKSTEASESLPGAATSVQTKD